MTKIRIFISWSWVLVLSFLVGCTTLSKKLQTTKSNPPTYNCTLSFQGKFREQYRKIPENHPVQIDIQLDIDPYVDDWDDAIPPADFKSRYLEFLPSSIVSITPLGENQAKFGIKEVLVETGQNLDNIVIYTDITITNQPIGGVLQAKPPIINFNDRNSATLSDDMIPTEKSVWDSFPANYIVITNQNDGSTYESAITFPAGPNGIAVSNCAANL